MIKKLVLIVILCYSDLISQNVYVVWGTNGEYLFNAIDSTELIKKIKEDRKNSVITYALAENYEYNVLLNDVSKIENKRTSFKLGDSKYKHIGGHDDSSIFSNPYYDSLPNGKWFKYQKDVRGNVEIKSIKEILNNLYSNCETVYNDGGYYINNYRHGYRVGFSVWINRNKQILYECKYKDSLNYILYEKVYDTLGHLINHRDYTKMTYKRYYPSGRINEKGNIDVYGNIIRRTIYDKKGQIKK